MQQSSSTTLLSTFTAILNAPHPVRQLWRGTLPSALRTGIGSALYFSTLNLLRERVAQTLATSQPTTSLYASSPASITAGTPTNSTSYSSSLPTLSNGANLATGALARASVGTLLMPVTVLKVRFESDLYAYRSLTSAARTILRNEGPRAFFTGVSATAARDAPYAGLYVLFYEQCKRRLSRFVIVDNSNSTSISHHGHMRGATSAGINFASGVLAATIATCLTNPCDALKTRMQLLPRQYPTMLQAASTMIREEGPRALLDGLALRMVRKGLSSALAWTVYEEVVRRGARSPA